MPDFLLNQPRADDRRDRHAHARQAAWRTSSSIGASATLRRSIRRALATLLSSTTQNISMRWPSPMREHAWWRRVSRRRRRIALPCWSRRSRIAPSLRWRERCFLLRCGRSSLFGANGRGGRGARASLGADRGGRDHRSAGGDRTRRRDRRRHADRGRRRGRAGRRDRTRLRDRRRRLGYSCAHRRPRDHSSRRPHRSGRVRLSSFAARSSENSADPPGHHSGRRGDRRQLHDRPRFDPRHRHRRGNQDRQSWCRSPTTFASAGTV